MLVIPTFGGYIRTFWGYKSFCLGVTNPYVWRLDFLLLGVRFVTFGCYKSLPLGGYITNPYVLGLDFLLLGDTNLYVWD